MNFARPYRQRDSMMDQSSSQGWIRRFCRNRSYSRYMYHRGRLTGCGSQVSASKSRSDQRAKGDTRYHNDVHKAFVTWRIPPRLDRNIQKLDENPLPMLCKVVPRELLPHGLCSSTILREIPVTCLDSNPPGAILQTLYSGRSARHNEGLFKALEQYPSERAPVPVDHTAVLARFAISRDWRCDLSQGLDGICLPAIDPPLESCAEVPPT
jgi:hypothetical protein